MDSVLVTSISKPPPTIPIPLLPLLLWSLYLSLYPSSHYFSSDWILQTSDWKCNEARSLCLRLLLAEAKTSGCFPVLVVSIVQTSRAEGTPELSKTSTASGGKGSMVDCIDFLSMFFLVLPKLASVHFPKQQRSEEIKQFLIVVHHQKCNWQVSPLSELSFSLIFSQMWRVCGVCVCACVIVCVCAYTGRQVLVHV